MERRKRGDGILRDCYWRGRRIQVPGSNSDGRFEWWFSEYGG